MRMRPVIVHLLPWQFGVGGAQRFMIDMVNWASNFADVHIFYRVGKDNFYKPNATLHHIDDPDEALRKLLEIKPDLIHYQNPCVKFLIPQVEQLQIPLIGTPHGYPHNAKEELSDWMIPIIGDHERKIYNGIPVEKFRVKRHEQKDKVVVGFVSRRSIEKYPESFLEAMRKRAPKNCHYKAVGLGWKTAYLDGITKSLKDLDFELLDDVLMEEMPSQLASFDIFVLASVSECCPYSIMEAMATGLPVVVRNSGGMPEVVGDAGIVCDSDDDILNAIEKLRDDVSLRRELGMRGRARAEKLFRIDRMFGQYNAVYSQVTKGLVRKPDPTLDASVVIPVYNTRRDWLSECMESVLSQDGNFEVILVDDGSTNPDTVNKMKEYADRPNVRLHRMKVQSGSGPANTKGVELAKSDIIIKIDSDDVMSPGRIKHQVEYLRANPDVALYSGQLDQMQDGKSLRRIPLTYHPNYPMWAQPGGVNPIAHSSVAMRRYPALAVGGYPVGYAQDFALWCKLQRAGYRIVVSKEVFATYRVYPAQNKPEKCEWDLRVRKQFSEGVIQENHSDQVRNLVLDIENKLLQLKLMLGIYNG